MDRNCNGDMAQEKHTIHNTAYSAEAFLFWLDWSCDAKMIAMWVLSKKKNLTAGYAVIMYSKNLVGSMAVYGLGVLNWTSLNTC